MVIIIIIISYIVIIINVSMYLLHQHCHHKLQCHHDYHDHHDYCDHLVVAQCTTYYWWILEKELIITTPPSSSSCAMICHQLIHANFEMIMNLKAGRLPKPSFDLLGQAVQG